ANFTWRFTPPGTTTWGIRTNFTYTQGGQSTVNLTVREVSGNLTYREITLFVDDQVPTANIKTNKTGSNIANGLTLRVDEGTVVRFDGSASTDFAYTGKVGVIPSPFERKTIALNASRTTDDYNNNSALTFTWTIPGPLVGSPGPTHTFSGVNISFAWQEWNLSYNVKLAVHDTGFPNGKWNWGNLSRNI